mmetsp:Transcript_25608/g.65920  ORF Transcript_25608/g.65920 Transcript_25608/m.65920 type:complete len:202 (-) Transcript_25608:197-802(-)
MQQRPVAVPHAKHAPRQRHLLLAPRLPELGHGVIERLVHCGRALRVVERELIRRGDDGVALLRQQLDQQAVRELRRRAHKCAAEEVHDSQGPAARRGQHVVVAHLFRAQHRPDRRRSVRPSADPPAPSQRGRHLRRHARCDPGATRRGCGCGGARRAGRGGVADDAGGPCWADGGEGSHCAREGAYLWATGRVAADTPHPG